MSNEISKAGKIGAGFLLVIFTGLAILLIIAYWPNKMPPIKEGEDGAWYTSKWFNVTLIEKPDSIEVYQNDSLHQVLEERMKTLSELQEDLTKSQSEKDSITKELEPSLKDLEKQGANNKKMISITDNIKRIHLNTILLLLVALMGFLGNMVHIASSFTSFVGNGTFKKSWTLWYFVKPFTAAALAIIVYFIIRAGFLSYGSGASGVSLYGILSLSALAGLFTDSATLKLKEVFEVIFKPKDERTGKLEGDDFLVLSVSPEIIPPAGESTITLTGKNLNKPDIKITMDGAIVAAVKTVEKIEIKYTPTAMAISAGKTVLLITDKDDKVLYPSKGITIGSPIVPDQMNNEGFPGDTESGIDHHDEGQISNNPPTDPPPNIR